MYIKGAKMIHVMCAAITHGVSWFNTLCVRVSVYPEHPKNVVAILHMTGVKKKRVIIAVIFTTRLFPAKIVPFKEGSVNGQE
jgi:hypothetical protein